MIDREMDRRRALSQVPVSRETEEKFAAFIDLLDRWQRAKNLVGPATLQEVWTRHIADSAQLFALAPGSLRWLDLGSGGGFPGIILGIMLAEVGGTIDLVESNGRKCAFLREAARITGASAIVHNGRIEDLVDGFAGKIDVVTARALARLPVLVGWCSKLLTSGARGIFPKGQDVAAELTETARYWKLSATQVPSKIEASGRIVIIDSLEGCHHDRTFSSASARAG